MIVEEFTVLESAHYISKHSLDVRINDENINKMAPIILDDMRREEYDLAAWKRHPLNPKVANKFAANWIFICDLLNFSFWQDSNSELCQIQYNGTLYSGYWALCAALNRAEDNGTSLCNYAKGASISFEQFAQLFAPDKGNHLPLLRDRYEIYRQAAKKLLEKYDGCITNLIARAEMDALKLVNLLIVEFPSFFDVALFNNEQVFFLKRAQIFVADLWACFEGLNYGNLDNIDSLTIFADYRIPQILSFMGILEYSDRLKVILEEAELIPSGSQLECEIRGCSMLAAELLKQEMKRTAPDIKINSVLLDFYLWDRAKKDESELSQYPIHRTRSVYY